MGHVSNCSVAGRPRAGMVFMAACVAVGLAACSPTRFETTSDIPPPLIDKIPVVIGVHLPLEFRDVTQDEVRSADELWVTSSSKEVLAIVTLDGKPVGDGKPGAVFRRMYGLYQEFKQKVMRAGKERQAA